MNRGLSYREDFFNYRFSYVDNEKKFTPGPGAY